MKNLVLLPALLLVIGFAQTLSAQNTFPANGAAGIGTSTPASSSLLDISSTSKGVLMPRMTKTQREAIVSPVEGLLIYQTNNQPGFYYYDGSALVNLIKSGRTWFGEVYDITTTYTYNFETPNLVNTEPIVLEVDGEARTFKSGAITNYSTFTVSSGSSFSGTISLAGITNSYTGPQGRLYHQNMTWNAGGSNVPVAITFNKFDPITSVGWLNYLRLNCTRELRMSGDQMAFRDLSSIGTGNIAEFVLDQAQNAQRIWEITDPTRAGVELPRPRRRLELVNDPTYLHCREAVLKFLYERHRAPALQAAE